MSGRSPKCQRKLNKHINVGNSYGNIAVISVAENGKYKKYNCRCLKCGKEIVLSGQNIYKLQGIGCWNCKKNADLQKKIKEYQEEYINKKYGQLTIINISVPDGGGSTIAICKCDCGNIKNIPLSRVKSGQAKTCGHDTAGNLKAGKEMAKSLFVGGTFIPAISGSRNKNKNNTSGINGVSYSERSGRYRAYITFCGKQYNLGQYDTLKEAADIRAEAEKEIYGNFLKWYEQKIKLSETKPGRGTRSWGG